MSEKMENICPEKFVIYLETHYYKIMNHKYPRYSNRMIAESVCEKLHIIGGFDTLEKIEKHRRIVYNSIKSEFPPDVMDIINTSMYRNYYDSQLMPYQCHARKRLRTLKKKISDKINQIYQLIKDIMCDT